MESELENEMLNIKRSIEDNIENYKFREALREAMNLARMGNKYLTDTEPWKLAKSDMDRVAVILNVSLQICANLSIAFEPFMPHVAQKLRDILNISTFEWDQLASLSILSSNQQINSATLLFEKVEDEQIEFQVNKLEQTKQESQKSEPELAPLKPECTFDDFMKMDIRTATVLEAERVPKTDKLLKLKIDTGLDIRTIVSGIAEYYTPEEMIGKQISILANLAPRKIKGIESKGMILMAKEENGAMKIVTPEEKLINGATIG
jgi:methionyl-tRNA synthetase